jgi:ribose 5-phosphate isomerase B
MKIAIASDHAGFEEKERLKPLLNELGIQYEDLGTISEESVDYPAGGKIRETEKEEIQNV